MPVAVRSPSPRVASVVPCPIGYTASSTAHWHDSATVPPLISTLRTFTAWVLLSSLRLLAIVIVLGAAAFFVVPVLWRSVMTTSVTIALEQTGYRLSYSVALGLQHAERIAIRRVDGAGQEQSSGWRDVFWQTTDTGVALYRTSDAKSYFFAMHQDIYRFDRLSGTLTASCEIGQFAAHTRLGLAVAHLPDEAARDALDTGAAPLQGYIGPVGAAGIVASPPVSRYYDGLLFLGRLGLSEDNLQAGFVAKTPEPRAALDLRCP